MARERDTERGMRIGRTAHSLDLISFVLLLTPHLGCAADVVGRFGLDPFAWAFVQLWWLVVATYMRLLAFDLQAESRL